MRFANINTESIVCKSEEGGTLELRYSNTGDPFTEGGEFELRFSGDSYSPENSVYLETYELTRLRDKINQILDK